MTPIKPFLLFKKKTISPPWGGALGPNILYIFTSIAGMYSQFMTITQFVFPLHFFK